MSSMTLAKGIANVIDMRSLEVGKVVEKIVEDDPLKVVNFMSRKNAEGMGNLPL